jgi:CheY-like chemotaxis protein/HPt (histidine-containing phosphotransfer) domain-containing protein
LVVDDNASNLRIAELILASIGHSVERASGADEALTCLAHRSYDAVLMDCQMPVIDGYELTRRIRRGDAAGVNPRIPIIAVTAFALSDDRAKCLEAGMDDYVTKPIRMAELIAAFQRQGFAAAAPGTSAARGRASPFDPQALALARALPGTDGPSLLPELVQRYLSAQPRQLGLIADAWHRQCFAELADHAHTLAAEAAPLGAVAIRDYAIQLEQAARLREEGAVEQHWRELCAAAAAVRPALAQLDLLPP